MNKLSLLILAALALIAPSAARADQSLIPNGSFEVASASGDWPDKWPKVDGASWQEEEGNHFLRLTVVTPEKAVLEYWLLPVKEGQYDLSFRARYKDIKPGKQPWFDGRVMMNFKDSAGKIVKGAPGAPTFRGSSDGWVSKSVRINVPAGVPSLEIMFTLFQAQSGTLDFDDVKLVPVSSSTTQAAK